MTTPSFTPGHFTWRELMTKDVAKAKGFYGELFGWTFEDVPMEGFAYTLINNGVKQVGGMMPLMDDSHPPHWMSYIAVDNVDKRYDLALSLGAEMVHPPSDIPQVGRFCIIKDPTGALISLMTPLGGTA